MTDKHQIVGVLAIFVAISGYAAGFGLYEGSARGNAMGGALVGKAVDASANFYNPATLTDMTGTVVTVGFTTEHPKCDTTVDGHKSGKMDPGCFMLPHLYLAQPLPHDFVFGLGIAPEFGLGTHYHQDWPLNWDTRQTQIEGVTFNPNLAYKITDDWSVSAGFRLMYFTFDQYSDRLAIKDGNSYGTVRDHLKGDNGMLDWGWQLSTKYDITKRLSAGVYYKSYIDTKVKGYNHTQVRKYDDSAVGPQVSKGVKAALFTAGLTPGNPVYDAYYGSAYKQAYRSAVGSAHGQVDQGAEDAWGPASAELRLPQSLTMGLNYDLADDWHLGVASTWTQWSSIDEINFKIPHGNDRTVPMDWNDSWRNGVGVAYDLFDNFTLMTSYIYDQDPCAKYKCTTMLPPGDRHLLTFGFAWTWGNLELAASYGLVFMNGMAIKVDDGIGHSYKFNTRNGLSHAATVSLSYRF